ncbi:MULTISPECIES: outer membrane protein OmpK [unclassified Variovorax]|uniref:outer membrane protein OmpK n=1 Tax=unclassified Variovorax TaxID=663243 RepID=UPI001BD66E3C|nr:MULTISPECIES: outer membrane protein OmpK [unclassified Variovorax]
MPDFRSTFPRALTAAIAPILACFGASAQAEDYSQTSIQLAYTTRDKNDYIMGTGASGGDRTTLRFEHFGTYSLGDNYVMFDAYNGQKLGEGNSNQQNFFVWNSHMSLGKLTGKELSWGPIKDVLGMLRLEDGSYGNYRAGSLGASVYWKLPFGEQSLLETSILARQKDYSVGPSQVRETRPLYRVYFYVPFQVAGISASFSGPVYLSPAGGGARDFYMEPEVFVSFGPKDVYSIGVRIEYHRVTGTLALNSAGERSRTTTNLALRWNM